MKTNIYLQLTDEFNAGRLRAIICSGQAAVLHRVAIMSKDGDWILQEDAECCRHILETLERHGAHYRFGAPLDVRWLSQGWSSHLEFTSGPLRIRTDFFTRPPRISNGGNDGRTWRAKSQACHCAKHIPSLSRKLKNIWQQYCREHEKD